jgi:signal transduction histidine kinase
MYTHHGGKVTIHVKEKEEASDWVTIRICDNGVGISPERQKRLCLQDRKLNPRGNRFEKGTGIGLRLVHELVTLSKEPINR